MRNLIALLVIAAGACGPSGLARQPNTAPQVVAPDSLARLQLAEHPASIRQEVRYATSDNFTGAPLPGYERGLVLLRRGASEALGGVAERLAAQGLGLKVWDGY